KETKDRKIKEINDYTEKMLNDLKAVSTKAIEAIDAEVSFSKEKLKQNLTDFAGLKKRISKLEKAEAPSFFIPMLILVLVIIIINFVFYRLIKRGTAP
ncbi:MAG: hypothetical protein GY950_06165, partial [bacterium]|nr:hypothetical protein [bacterium]